MARRFNVTDKMVEKALDAWFSGPQTETDMGLARSMKRPINAALKVMPGARVSGGGNVGKCDEWDRRQ